MDQIVAYLIKEKRDGKYLCKPFVVLGNTLTEMCLKIKLDIRRNSLQNYSGAIFYHEGLFYVTDKLGKIVAKTEQNLYDHILTI